jgi:ankyrin repeat protein
MNAVETLLKAGPVGDLDCEAFWWTVSRGHESALKDLMRESKFDVNCRNHKATPFGEAVAQGHLQIAELLLATGKVDVNARLKDKDQTPLCNAAAAGGIELVKLLL